VNINTTTMGGTANDLAQTVVTSGLSPEEMIQKLDSYGIDWYITDHGDLLIKYWQVGAEGIVAPERVATIRAGRAVPNEARALEWVSGHLAELRQQYGGQWIAIVGTTVAVSEPTLSQLLQRVEELGIERPFVTEIPAGEITWITTYARSIV
jgi:hypothetical protein